MVPLHTWFLDAGARSERGDNCPGYPAARLWTRRRLTVPVGKSLKRTGVEDPSFPKCTGTSVNICSFPRPPSENYGVKGTCGVGVGVGLVVGARGRPDLLRRVTDFVEWVSGTRGIRKTKQGCRGSLPARRSCKKTGPLAPSLFKSFRTLQCVGQSTVSSLGFGLT